MHLYFSGIGGVGIGPLALIAKQAGFEVSGSDVRGSQYIDYLKRMGVTDIHIGQSREAIEEVHNNKPIDWFVYSSALNSETDHSELAFCKEMDIKTSKRDELLNKIIQEKGLKLIAIAGTHGKTTTTAMTVWLFKQLGMPVSYSLGAKISFGDMGHYEPDSQYFIYECDEFDRNFLGFHPFFSIISGVGYDHHEIYPTEEDYKQAFRDFLNQSQRTVLWQEDATRLGIDEADEKYAVESEHNPDIEKLELPGLYNRRDARLVIKAVSQLVGPRPEELHELMNSFPGVSRRFEKIADNLYSDDAHTPEKILGCMSVAKETAGGNQSIVVLYEPLTNRRMHYLGTQHRSVFEGASEIYWLPSYLTREDPELEVLTPEQLIKNLSPELQKITHPAQKDEQLKTSVQKHLETGDLVIAMAGGGGDSLDEWLRKEFADYAKGPGLGR